MCNEDGIFVGQGGVVDAGYHAWCEFVNFSSVGCGTLNHESIPNENGDSNVALVIWKGESEEIAEFVLSESKVVLDNLDQ